MYKDVVSNATATDDADNVVAKATIAYYTRNDCVNTNTHTHIGAMNIEVLRN